MAELPKRLQVGYLTYAVEQWAKSPPDQCGECDNNWGIIKVDVQYGPQRTAEILLHEVLHAIYRNGAIEAGDEEERVVTILANQLSQIWRDNPELVTFLSESLR